MLELSRAVAAERQRPTVKKVIEVGGFRLIPGVKTVFISETVSTRRSFSTWSAQPHQHVAPSGLAAGTSAGFGRTATEDNCCCYYWDCCTHCCLGWHTEPCPQEDLDSAFRIEEQLCCQRQQVGTRWEGVEGVEEAVQARRLLVAFAHTQGPRRERRPRARAAAHRHGVALRQPSVQPPPPSSLPSTPYGSL